MARKPVTNRKTKSSVKRTVTVQEPTSAPLWHSWRHIAAYIYLFICFFDFVGMPVYYEFAHKPLSKTQLVTLVSTMEPTNQVQAMQIISTEQRWEPLTLGETGLFHVAFGAILGVAAFSRGQERSRSSQRGYFDGRRGRNQYEYETEYADDMDEDFEPEPDVSGTATADGTDPFADPKEF